MPVDLGPPLVGLRHGLQNPFTYVALAAFEVERQGAYLRNLLQRRHETTYYYSSSATWDDDFGDTVSYFDPLALYSHSTEEDIAATGPWSQYDDQIAVDNGGVNLQSALLGVVIAAVIIAIMLMLCQCWRMPTALGRKTASQQRNLLQNDNEALRREVQQGNNAYDRVCRVSITLSSGSNYWRHKYVRTKFVARWMIHSLATQRRILYNQNQGLRERISDKDSKLGDLKRELKDKQSVIDGSIAMIDKLEASERKKEDELKTLCAANEELQEQKNNAEQQAKRLQSEKHATERQLNEERVKNARLEEAKQEMQGKLNITSKDLKNAQEGNALVNHEMERQLNEEKVKNAQLEKAQDEMQEKLDTTSKDLKNAQDDNAYVNQELECQLDEEKSKNARLEEAQEEMQEKLDATSKDLNNAQDENALVNQDLRKAEKETKECEANGRKTTRRVRKLEDDIGQLQAENDNIDILKYDLEKEQKKVAKLMVFVRKLQGQSVDSGPDFSGDGQGSREEGDDADKDGVEKDGAAKDDAEERTEEGGDEDGKAGDARGGAANDADRKNEVGDGQHGSEANNTPPSPEEHPGGDDFPSTTSNAPKDDAPQNKDLDDSSDDGQEGDDAPGTVVAPESAGAAGAIPSPSQDSAEDVQTKPGYITRFGNRGSETSSTRTGNHPNRDQSQGRAVHSNMGSWPAEGNMTGAEGYRRVMREEEEKKKAQREFNPPKGPRSMQSAIPRGTHSNTRGRSSRGGGRNDGGGTRLDARDMASFRRIQAENAQRDAQDATRGTRGGGSTPGRGKSTKPPRDSPPHGLKAPNAPAGSKEVRAERFPGEFDKPCRNGHCAGKKGRGGWCPFRHPGDEWN